MNAPDPAPAPATLRAPCKVNLVLDITDVLDNGYHELRTLFWPLPEPCDTLEIHPLPPGQHCRLHVTGIAVPEKGNLVVEAWRKFALATGYEPSILVKLDKRIPVGAGLGGGSSDAAAMLRWLNGQAGLRGLPEAGLRKLATELGADVPFFLLGRPAWAEGIGEKLAEANVNLSGYTLLLACPEVHVSTKWAYAQWDRIHAEKDEKDRGPRTGEGFLTWPAGDSNEPSSVSPLVLRNAFETAVFPAFPELRELKEHLLRHGAAAAVLSGSGASVAALFRIPEKAAEAAATLQAQGTNVFLHQL